MLYSLTKPLAKITLGIYFRKLYISNRERLPIDKPIILAANHPTAFVEPCIIACWLEQDLSYLARGDLYVNNAFIRKLYDAYRMTPVFRLQDTGFGNLKSNYASFERCFDALKDRRTIMILAEGRTKHEKRLRPMMKGTARIVFGALEKYGDLDIHVVPVGVNYSDSDRFRSIAMIDFGEPIRATEYSKIYEENPAKAVNAITKELGKRLLERVIHIENVDDDKLVEPLLEMAENDENPRFPRVMSPDGRLLFREKKIADFVNGMGAEEKSAFGKKVGSYLEQLKTNGLTDLGLTCFSLHKFKYGLLLILGWLPQMVGMIWNAPPILLGKYYASKIAPAVEFRAAVTMAFSTTLWLIWAILQIVAVAIWGKSWMFAAGFLMPALGYFYLIYRELHRKWKAAWPVNKLDRQALADILRQRAEIQKMLP